MSIGLNLAILFFVSIGFLFGYGVGRSEGDRFVTRVKNYFNLNKRFIR